MHVTVKLHGALGSASGRPAPGPFDLRLPADATAADLMRELVGRVGTPFVQALESRDTRLPRTLRMFVEGEMIVTRDQPLAAPGVTATGVTVVLMSPVAGGIQEEA